MKTVIMAGGKGTRIAQINSDVPKPMIKVLGKTILEYQIETLKRQNCIEIIIVVGHMGQIIQDHFGDGSKFGVQIQYIVEDTPLGTAGALFLLKDEIKEDFLLLNGDMIFDVDICKFSEVHKSNGKTATILTHPNDHPYDSGIVVADKQGIVTQWLSKEDKRGWYKNRVNAGLHMLSPRIFSLFDELKKVDLDREILKPLIKDKELSIYDSPEYVRDMGTPERYYSVIEDLQSGKVAARNLAQKQKAIFLDRDGTINKDVGFLTKIDDFQLTDAAAKAIKMINKSGYLAIVVTNQPVIARGEVSEEELEEIHCKMETLLGNEGAYVDDIFYCPHHPHAGFEGERIEYKIDCDCRKPKPGMLIAAAEKYNIDLSSSWMIGDTDRDMEAGIRAGCQVMMIKEYQTDNESVRKSHSSLLECVEDIFTLTRSKS
jgi:D-glycero-D-manno-heptose 1,7-bisphosphate phosphatase